MNLATLGDVLYPAGSKPRIPEQDWVRLVNDAAAGEVLALHTLYQKAHRPVFTLAMRSTGSRDASDELTLDVFHDVWQRAAGYSTADGTVLGWIMNLARARVIEKPPAGAVAAQEQNLALKDALRSLSTEERSVLEGAYFSGRDSAPGQARSALHKLARVLGAKTNKEENNCGDADLVCAYLLQELSSGEERRIEAHLASCSQCRHELETLRPVVDTFVAWPTDVLRPPAPLRARLARRIAGGPNAWLVLPQGRPEPQPEWEDVAPGISVKILASDPARHMVSMLVHLVPGGEYPPHTHAGVEELHLLEGELWIDERKLHAGDYNRAEPGTGDKRVWSETGCSCVLVTSTRDVLS
jgi:hypothetical protein